LTGQKIQRILRKEGLAAKIPEDLYHLIKKALNIRKHMEKNKSDKDAKYRLTIKESRIHRITRYYRRTGKVPTNFKYNY
jgi:small subunit ribosomal protein S13e